MLSEALFVVKATTTRGAVDSDALFRFADSLPMHARRARDCALVVTARVSVRRVTFCAVVILA